MIGWLKDRLGQDAPQAFDPVAPGQPFYGIGDIHGCAGLLERLLGQLTPGVPVVCVGDYVDRGEQSAAVLRLLSRRPDTVCLRGNHEQMMLDFLTRPQKVGRVWLRNGGLQTLASFGVKGVTIGTTGAALDAASAALREAMGQDLIAWMDALPGLYQSGTVAVVHAGADPAVPMASQDAKTLFWGHPEFNRRERTDGIWVMHGHTIVPEPVAEHGKIAIDTGAYATGRLTAALVAEGEVQFLST